MRVTTITMLALATAMAPTIAHADEGENDTGFYLGLNAGIASTNDPSIEYYDVGGTFGGTGSEDTATGAIDLKSAAQFGGTLGYDFGTVRADVEVGYARNKVNSLAINAVNGTAITLDAADRADVCAYLELDTCGGSGNAFETTGLKLRQLSAMANIWLDIPAGEGFVPYVGGGVGISGFEVDGEGKGKFAWQLGAGAAIKLSDKLFLTADMRHREVSKTDIDYDATSGFRLGKLKTNSFAVGLRLGF